MNVLEGGEATISTLIVQRSKLRGQWSFAPGSGYQDTPNSHRPRFFTRLSGRSSRYLSKGSGTPARASPSALPSL